MKSFSPVACSASVRLAVLAALLAACGVDATPDAASVNLNPGAPPVSAPPVSAAPDCVAVVARHAAVLQRSPAVCRLDAQIGPPHQHVCLGAAAPEPQPQAQPPGPRVPHGAYPSPSPRSSPAPPTCTASCPSARPATGASTYPAPPKIWARQRRPSSTPKEACARPCANGAYTARPSACAASAGSAPFSGGGAVKKRARRPVQKGASPHEKYAQKIRYALRTTPRI